MPKFLKIFPLTSWLFPHSCNKCGDSYVRFDFNSLTPDIQEKHRIAGTAEIVKTYAYTWPNGCLGENISLVI